MLQTLVGVAADVPVVVVGPVPGPVDAHDARFHSTILPGSCAPLAGMSRGISSVPSDNEDFLSIGFQAPRAAASSCERSEKVAAFGGWSETKIGGGGDRDKGFTEPDRWSALPRRLARRLGLGGTGPSSSRAGMVRARTVGVGGNSRGADCRFQCARGEARPARPEKAGRVGRQAEAQSRFPQGDSLPGALQKRHPDRGDAHYRRLVSEVCGLGAWARGPPALA
jgi:hypothetical protein